MRRRARGHNLLEMIIACFILATVTIGLTTVWIQHSRVMNKAGGRLVGQFLANEMMETCIAAGYDSVDELIGIRPQVDMNETVRNINKVVVYIPEVKVTPTVLPDGREVKIVEVEVTWVEQEGRGSVKYTSQLASAGVGGP